MCGAKEQITLSETENGIISWCKCCRSYTLAYKACCAAFNDQDFKQFESLLHHLTDNDFHFQLNDSEQVLLKTPTSKVGFCLTQREVWEIQGMIREAKIINEVFRLIYTR